MRAVNLVPADARRGTAGRSRAAQAPTYLLLAALAVALALVTVYVLTSNTISDREAKLVSLHDQEAKAQAQATRLVNYAQFEKLAQARATTVRQIASARFDWHAALSELSRVVPANTSLQSLVATVAPGGSSAGGPGPSSAGASSAGVGSGIRSDIAAPAFELAGCTATQDDVARLMSRLRLINGVTRVTLGDSQKSDGGQTGASVTSASTAGGGSGAGGGCGSGAPTFDLVVFFKALPSAAVTGPASQTPTTPAGAAGRAATHTTGSTTTSGGTR